MNKHVHRYSSFQLPRDQGEAPRKSLTSLSIPQKVEMIEEQGDVGCRAGILCLGAEDPKHTSQKKLDERLRRVFKQVDYWPFGTQEKYASIFQTMELPLMSSTIIHRYRSELEAGRSQLLF
jgi:hypothetical protein